MESRALLSDPALVVRSLAVETLIADGDPSEIRPVLWQELDQPRNFHKNKSLWIRGQILEYLRRQPLPKEKDHWSQLLRDPDQKIKTVAKYALTALQ